MPCTQNPSQISCKPIKASRTQCYVSWRRKGEHVLFLFPAGPAASPSLAYARSWPLYAFLSPPPPPRTSEPCLAGSARTDGWRPKLLPFCCCWRLKLQQHKSPKRHHHIKTNAYHRKQHHQHKEESKLIPCTNILTFVNSRNRRLKYHYNNIPFNGRR